MLIEKNEIEMVSQADLCTAQYYLHLCADDMSDHDDKEALMNVQEAIHLITNHYGKLALASKELIDYYNEDEKEV